MSTYAIGDLQGCFTELKKLLDCVNYQPKQDQLWFVGDLVNRGPQSLDTLRFVKNLPNKKVVLGNHDLHLIALACGHPYHNHSLEEILQAPDRNELIDWLRKQPLLHHDANLGFIMVHAGLPPQWDLDTAKKCASEVATMLQSDKYPKFVEEMYGDKPDIWQENLSGWDRLRFIVNAFTRIRFCTSSGQLDLHNKGGLMQQSSNTMPWFKVPNRANNQLNIIFGHWAALEGKADAPNVFALDTGCVWGNQLTAMRLEDKKLFSVASSFKL